MIERLPQFAISEVCLSCDGCCRFYEDESCWRPRCGKKEIEQIARPEWVDEHFYIKAPRQGEHFFCVALEGDQHHCEIYSKRPLECQIYPFVLLLKNQRRVVAVHLSCSLVVQYRQSVKFVEYVEQLQKFFAEAEVRQFLKDNVHLAGEYPGFEQEFEELFEVKI